MRTGQLPAIINHIGAKSVADLRMAETRGLRIERILPSWSLSGSGSCRLAYRRLTINIICKRVTSPNIRAMKI